MPNFESGAFVELRASTDKLKGDLRGATSLVKDAFLVGPLTGQFSPAVSALARGAGIVGAGLFAGYVMQEAIARADPGGGRMSNLKNELGRTKRALSDLNFQGNATFGLLFKGVDGLAGALSKGNTFLERFVDTMAELGLAKKKAFPQSGSFATPFGTFKYNPNQQVTTGVLGGVDRPFMSSGTSLTKTEVAKIHSDVSKIKNIFSETFGYIKSMGFR